MNSWKISNIKWDTTHTKWILDIYEAWPISSYIEIKYSLPCSVTPICRSARKMIIIENIVILNLVLGLVLNTHVNMLSLHQMQKKTYKGWFSFSEELFRNMKYFGEQNFTIKLGFKSLGEQTLYQNYKVLQMAYRILSYYIRFLSALHIK